MTLVSNQEDSSFVIQSEWGAGHPLYEGFEGEDSLQTKIFKAVGSQAESRQTHDAGEQPHNFQFREAKLMMTSNGYHSTCIYTKKESTVGQGFASKFDLAEKRAKALGLPPPDPDTFSEEDKESIVDRLLNPLCKKSWQETYSDTNEDYWQIGLGYLEIRRESPEKNAKIIGIFHLPAEQVWVFLEENKKGEGLNGEHHYVHRAPGRSEVHFAEFGDVERFLKDNPEYDAETSSEVICFRLPSSLSVHYSWPDWASATPIIELAQCETQHEFDFYLNRAVPEFLWVLMNANMSKDDQKKIDTSFKANIGIGNSRKSMMINIHSAEAKSIVHQLGIGAEGAEGFGTRMQPLALMIVSAHRVPPLLAGIQIAGKMGAANEMVQAMASFQSLVVAPAQKINKSTLGQTLGNSKLNGGLSLKPSDFRFNTILDTIAGVFAQPQSQERGDQGMKNLDTVARSRTSPTEPRNPADGLRRK